LPLPHGTGVVATEAGVGSCASNSAEPPAKEPQASL